MKPPARERLPGAELESAQLILVVAHEHERGSNFTFPFTLRGSDFDMEATVPAPDAHGGDTVRKPLAASDALHRGALRDEAGVHTDARVVDEGSAIEVADIDGHRPAPGDRLRGLAKVERNANILREVIERAERQYAERRIGCRQDRCRSTDGSVSAGGDDDARATLERIGSRGSDSGTIKDTDISLTPGCVKHGCDALRRHGVLAAGAPVQQDGNPLHGDWMAGVRRGGVRR